MGAGTYARKSCASDTMMVSFSSGRPRYDDHSGILYLEAARKREAKVVPLTLSIGESAFFEPKEMDPDPDRTDLPCGTYLDLVAFQAHLRRSGMTEGTIVIPTATERETFADDDRS